MARLASKNVVKGGWYTAILAISVRCAAHACIDVAQTVTGQDLPLSASAK